VPARSQPSPDRAPRSGGVVERKEKIAGLHLRAAFDAQIGNPSRLRRSDKGRVAFGIAKPGMIVVLSASAKGNER